MTNHSEKVLYDLTNRGLREEWKKMNDTSGADLMDPLQALIDYFQKNRSFCLSIMNSSQNYRIEKLFVDQITDIIRQRLEELESYKYENAREISMRSECCSIAIASMLRKWLTRELKCTESELVSYMKEIIAPLSDICSTD